MQMTEESSSDVAAAVHRDGYFVAQRWHPDRPTIDVSRSVGIVLDVASLLQGSGIPTVQTLKPRRHAESPANQYSGRYGLGEFPLHTDLAHWAQPPRYFVLRCRVGSRTVTTTLLPSSTVVSTLGLAALRRAVVRPRRPPRGGVVCPLPVVFAAGSTGGFRWDPLFLLPMNQPAERLADVMSTTVWDQRDVVTFTLADDGDTLIVDNWRFLHGRSSVNDPDVARQVERVYLSGLHK
jgi:L-asparagine oxygenase